MSSRVWIGDLITAWNAEGRDPSKLDTLVDMLGMSTIEIEETLTVEDESTFARLAKGGLGGLGAPSFVMPSAKPIQVPSVGPVTPVHPTTQRRIRAVVIEALPPEIPTKPVWSGDALSEATSPHVPQRLQPLFPHATARALVGAAAHSVRHVGQVDISEAVRIVSSRRPVRDIPRDTARTMRAGVQLVIDRTWAMKPFADDIAVLRKQLFTVVGRDRIEELWFSGDLATCRRPLRVAAKARAKADSLRGATEAWQPPEGGIPVIVVTDLGRADEQRGNEAVAAEWRALFARAAAAGCEVVTIVPRRVGRADRFDRTTPVAWDTRTTAGKVIADRGKRHG